MKSLLSTLAGGNCSDPYSIEGVYKRLQKTIEYAWEKADVSINYIDLMCEALSFNFPKPEELNKIANYWALLPGLCCQAAGGSIELADPVAAAWIVFYLAAHIMDSVQDNDVPDSWWIGLSPGIALNVASGLFFTANTILLKMFNLTYNQEDIKQVINDFNQYLLLMCDGQHQDLNSKQRFLDNFWEISSRKSGSFFTLACQSGARLATKQINRIGEYGRFGFHLGMIIQVLDELEDWHVLTTGGDPAGIKNLSSSLPILYTFHVVPEAIQFDLKKKIAALNTDPQVVGDIIYEVNRYGAPVYILAELERHDHLARTALQNAEPEPTAGAKLLSLLNRLVRKDPEL